MEAIQVLACVLTYMLLIYIVAGFLISQFFPAHHLPGKAQDWAIVWFLVISWAWFRILYHHRYKQD